MSFDLDGELPKGITSVSSNEADIEDTKTLLQEYLDDIRGARTWFSFGVDENPVNPGLYLKNSGIVGLPLSEQGAKRIEQQVCPVKQQDIAYVDQIRNYKWELDLGEFELRNPSWQKYFQALSLRATQAFDIGAVETQGPRLVLWDAERIPTSPK